MRKKPTLPPGWSWPLKPSEVDELLPGVGHVYWSSPWGPGRSSRPSDEGWLVSARWRAGSGFMPPLQLTIYPAPSALRQDLRREIIDVVAPSIARWHRLADESEGWRLLDHYEGWFWSAAGTVRRDPSSS